MAFSERLIPYITLAKRYEDTGVQAAARRTVPLSELMTNAQKQADAIIENWKAGHISENSGANSAKQLQHPDKALLLKHCLLLQLLKWFKTEFFCWFDNEKCKTCDDTDCVPVYNATLSVPTSDEKRYGGDHIEVYQCPRCTENYRFPRFNDPLKLLKTRRGRCGEWANAFTLCCRASGFDARFVLDFTDHVWTEVWSDLEGRWLHCDPCENVCDKPLLYEAGWGKKLSYVFAFSRDELVDVTWRYTSEPDVLKHRRTLISEPALSRVIGSLNHTHYGTVPSQRANVALNRRVVEVVEFLNCSRRATTSAEQVGRTSGSLDWRLTRGETNSATNTKYVFSVDAECNDVVSVVRFEYNVISDRYTVYYDSREIKSYNRWQDCVFAACNVERKIEQDWHMAYLCRTPDSDIKLDGTIEWRFDLSCRKMEKVVVHATNTACFETGSVKWLINILPSNHEKEETSTGARELDWTTVSSVVMQDGYDCTELVNNCKHFDAEHAPILVVRAVLSGGQSWQHAQLFRSSTKQQQQPDAHSSPQLAVNIKFANSDEEKDM